MVFIVSCSDYKKLNEEDFISSVDIRFFTNLRIYEDRSDRIIVLSKVDSSPILVHCNDGLILEKCDTYTAVHSDSTFTKPVILDSFPSLKASIADFLRLNRDFGLKEVNDEDGVFVFGFEFVYLSFSTEEKLSRSLRNQLKYTKIRKGWFRYLFK